MAIERGGLCVRVRHCVWQSVARVEVEGRQWAGPVVRGVSRLVRCVRGGAARWGRKWYGSGGPRRDTRGGGITRRCGCGGGGIGGGGCCCCSACCPWCAGNGRRPGAGFRTPKPWDPWGFLAMLRGPTRGWAWVGCLANTFPAVSALPHKVQKSHREPVGSRQRVWSNTVIPDLHHGRATVVHVWPRIVSGIRSMLCSEVWSAVPAGTTCDSSVGAGRVERPQCAVLIPTLLAWWTVHSSSMVEQDVWYKGAGCVGVGPHGPSAGTSSGRWVKAWEAVMSPWAGVRRPTGVAKKVAVAHWGKRRVAYLG